MAKNTQIKSAEVIEVKPVQAPDTVAVGCRLPHGLILRVELEDKQIELELKGLNSTGKGLNGEPIIVSDHIINAVDKEFWELWKKQNAKTFQPFLNQAIFEAGSYADAKSLANELKNEKTGFEPADPSKEKGIKTLEV